MFFSLVPPVLKVCKAEEEGKVEVEHDDEDNKPEKEASKSPVGDKVCHLLL